MYNANILNKLTLVIHIYLFVCFTLGSCNNVNGRCLEIEKKALLNFKEGLKDPSGRLASWVGADCCNWYGLSCNNVTGHVIKLDLTNSLPSDAVAQKKFALKGMISPSLINLKHLEYLDLSFNDFQGNQIPEFIGSITSLKYLNLCQASLAGKVPPHLGNLSSLRYFDLHSFSDSNHVLTANDFHWLTGLLALEYLDFGGADLGSVVNWIQELNKLPSLLELHLNGCNLHGIHYSVPIVNFTSLAVIDLSNNLFGSPIPSWILNMSSLQIVLFSSSGLRGSLPNAFGNMISLRHLDLSHQFIEGSLPSSLGNLCKLQLMILSQNNFSGNVIEFVDSLSRNNSLEVLDLTENRFNGELPSSLGNLTKLRSLLLRQNMFWGSLPASIGSLSSLQILSLFGNPVNGSIPESIGQLSQLVIMDFGQTLWTGSMSNKHFLNLTQLEKLEISSTSLKKTLNFSVDSYWNPPFKLKSVILAHIQAGPSFPEWIQTQNNLTTLFLNDVGISDTLPQWFWSWCSQHIDDLDLAHNQIQGTVPISLHFRYETNVYLISNNFSGPLPVWSNVVRLYLWSNAFSGTIPRNISEIMPILRDLDLSKNNLSGVIPPTIINMKYLRTLVLSENHLSGELPRSWSLLQDLQVLDVSNNSLSGGIPSSIGFLHNLQLLSLSSNNFVGEIPSSFQNCTALWNFDLGKNRLSGSIPTWIGSIPSLLILRLHSNFFSGEIPSQLCKLSYLHALDLGENNLSGAIPKCIGNLSGMVSEVPSEYIRRYEGHLEVTAKGREIEYSSTLSLVKIIDLSSNNLRGTVPEEITMLHRLGTLNLSMNHLTGRIPPDVGNLRWLETFDLSKNQISGVIPPSLSFISSLNHLNLSYNKLEGKIPLGNQLQTLNDPSIFEGNPGLCGGPLAIKCPEDEASSEKGNESNGADEDKSHKLYFFNGLASGFGAGFFGVCGSLLLNKSWREAYFQFINKKWQNARVFVAVNVALLLRRFRSQEEVQKLSMPSESAKKLKIFSAVNACSVGSCKD